MLRVCIVVDENMDLNLWAATLAAFPVDEIYLVGAVPAEAAQLKPLRGARVVADARDVPGELVVLSPRRGERLPGTVALADHRAGDDVTYFFGADNRHLEASAVGREPLEVVFVEVPGFDHLFAHVAAAIVLHAREVSRG